MAVQSMIWSESKIASSLPLLFVARMLVIYLVWIRGMKHVIPPFLPFWEGLDYLREVSWLYTLLDMVYWGALVAVALGYRFQRFSLILALLIFFQIWSSKLMYSTSFLYAGSMFFLIGLFRPGMTWIFRIQIALLYFGAGLNKLLDPDWLNGQYFQNFICSAYPNPLNLRLASWFGLSNLSLILSYFTIVAELGLAVWVLSRKCATGFFLAVVFFHFGMLVFTIGELSYIYFFLMAVTSYLILDWSDNGIQKSFSRQVSTAWQRTKSAIFQKKKEPIGGYLKKNELFHPLNEEGSSGELTLNHFFKNKFAFFMIISAIVFFSKYKQQLIHLFYDH